MGRATGWRVEDIDERIEARERRTIATIFAQQGEAHFRQLERQALSELIADRQIDRRHRRRHVRRDGQSRADARRRCRGVARCAAGPRHRPRARRRTSSARRRSRAAGTAVCATAARVRRRAPAHRCHACRFPRWSNICWSGSSTDAIPDPQRHPRQPRGARRRAVGGRTMRTHALVLGDLVGYGADPNAVIERVRALPNATIIRGNHDKVGSGRRDGRAASTTWRVTRSTGRRRR